MKLKRIRKVEYTDNGEYPLSIVDKMLYPVHFIDNDDWLCIDEEDYTPEKIAERRLRREEKRGKEKRRDDLMFIKTLVMDFDHLHMSICHIYQ